MPKEFSVKNERKKYREKGVFHTPEPLARYMLEFVDIDYKTAYDPTCGTGNLLAVLPDDVLKFGQEINSEMMTVARDRLSNFEGVVGDTLIEPAFCNKKFDLVIANPPFSVKWISEAIKKNEKPMDIRFKDAPRQAPNSKADYAFLLHCIHYMKDDGVCIALMHPGILYRGNAEGEIRKWLVEQNLIDTVVNVPAKQFVDTAIATVILVIRRTKKNTDIKFIDKELDKEKIVSLEEITEEDYILSVSNYIQPEYNGEKIEDIGTFNNDLRQTSMRNLMIGIKQEEMMDMYFGHSNAVAYMDSIIEMVRAERRKFISVKKGQLTIDI